MPATHYEERPWGHFKRIFSAPGLVVKVLFVKPGARLSDQRHLGRSETWYVQSGTPTVYLEHEDGKEETLKLKEGDMVEFSVKTWHRLSAENSKDPVRITEMWHGEHLDENDIERRADDYGRA